MFLKQNVVQNICKIGKLSEVYSFLLAGAGGFECAKGTVFEEAVRKKRAANEMNAKGDNCSGPPDFVEVPCLQIK